MTHHPASNPLAVAQVGEFKELAHAAGAQYRGLLYQVLKSKNSATLIGSGKVQELKTMIESTVAEIVIFDHPLSGVQIRNLEKELMVKVMDRNQLILDIFAQRARTYEGKLQVELAQALDELPRMVGAWLSSLSRQGGGIGTKGPGEKAIEKDRRQVQNRVRTIQKKLDKICRVRKGHRALRKKNQIPTGALIGYTNSGKSSLLNALTNDHSVPVKKAPFMTLDPTTRKIHINASKSILLTDTVGFIQGLSPHLIEAFKATLEESANADILLHVIDLSSPLMKTQIDTVNKLIFEFGWDEKPCIHVYNKIDIAPKEKVTHAQKKVFVSALKSKGLQDLKHNISLMLDPLQTKKVQIYFHKNEEEKIYSLDREALIYKKETSSLGVLCDVQIAVNKINKWQSFIVKIYN